MVQDIFLTESARAADRAAYVMQHKTDPDKGHAQHLTAFLDAVRGRGRSPCTVAEAVVATRVAFAAIESLRRGQVDAAVAPPQLAPLDG